MKCKNKKRVQRGGNKSVAYVINLDDNKERWLTIESKFNNSSIHLHRISAIKNNNGHLGCGLSFQKVVEMAKKDNLPAVLIMEDDCKPLDDFDKRWILTKKWLDENMDKWDIFNGGARIAHNEADESIQLKYIVDKPNNIYLFQGNNLWAAHWIYINKSVYDKILSWKQSSEEWALDRLFGNNNKIKNLFIFPFLALQEDGISATNNYHRDFNKEKAWEPERLQKILDSELKKQEGGDNTQRIILINYADKGYKKARHDQKDTAINIGNVDEVIEYSLKDIDSNFSNENKEILSQKRGAGYWLWKPYLILKTLKTMKENDILIYCDTAMKFVSSIKTYIENMKGSSLLFQHSENWIENQWTKADIFVYYKCKDNKDITDTKQLDASHSIWKKNDKTVAFISEWLEACKNKHFIDDSPSIEPNFEKFHENRHDQSLLSVLAKLKKDEYDIQIEFSATEFGNNERNSVYPQLLNHHRNRE